MQPQTRDEESLREPFSVTRGAPAVQGLDPWPWHLSTLFALIAADIESLVAGFASQARKKRAAFLAQQST